MPDSFFTGEQAHSRDNHWARILMPNGIVCLFCLVLLMYGMIPRNLHAQPGSATPSNVRAVNTIERLTDSNGLGTNELMFGIPLPDGRIIGDTYLEKDWRVSVLYLYDGNTVIKNYPVRYDIKEDQFEVKTDAGIKGLSGQSVVRFTCVDSPRGKTATYVNAKEYVDAGSRPQGFFEILVDGKIPLLKRESIVVKKADYNVQLSIGSRDDKILKKSSYYYANSSRISPLPGNRKKLQKVFGGQSSEVGQFIDRNALSVREERDLIEIFHFYDSTMTK